MMFQRITIGIGALAMLSAPVAGLAQIYDGDAYRDQREEYRDDRAEYRDDRAQYRDDRRNIRRADDWRQYRNYNEGRPAPGETRYYADRYYRDGRYYQSRRVGANERIYRGRDNQYYCRRSDGTTGLIIGGIGGGVLGSAIAPGGSNTLGAVLGGGLGAVLGSSIDKGNVTCR